MNLGENLGERLKYLRKKAGLTREDVATKLQISCWTVARYETNERSPDNNTLKKLADFYKTTIDFLLGRTDNPSPPDEPDLEYSMYMSLQKSNLSEAAKKQFMRAFRENMELIRQLERLETK